SHPGLGVPAGSGTPAPVSRDFTVDLLTHVAVTGPTGQTGASPTITGEGEAGSTIAVSLVGPTAVSGTTMVAPDGSWQWPVPMSLADGAYVITAVATDIYGHTASAMGMFEVNTSSYVDIITPANGS